MRHADDHVLEAELAAALQDLLEGRDHRLAAVEAEALGAGVLLVEELLEDLGGGQPLQDGPLAVDREIGLVADGLDALLYPGLLGRVLDVHELDADRPAVGGAHHLDRSEEHTSELQSLMRISYAVFCLKKKNTNKLKHNTQTRNRQF